MSTFFIGGSQRSGSAILQELLCRDPTCHSLADAGYLRMLLEAYRGGKREFDGGSRACFGSALAYRRFNAETVRRFLDTCASRRPNQRHLLFSDPGLTAHFPEIYELIPDARFILIVRDPRDLIAGLIEPDETLSDAGVSHIFQRRRIRPLCQYVRSYYQPTLRCELYGFRQRLSVLRYEDLVRKPQAILAQLKAFTGLELDPPPDSRPQAAPASLAMASGGGRVLETGSADTVGRYRHVLSRREASAIAVELHEFFVTFGYA